VKRYESIEEIIEADTDELQEDPGTATNERMKSSSDIPRNSKSR
jgi:hypothetical protein